VCEGIFDKQQQQQQQQQQQRRNSECIYRYDRLKIDLSCHMKEQLCISCLIARLCIQSTGVSRKLEQAKWLVSLR
jgi:hypothetical protein